MRLRDLIVVALAAAAGSAAAGATARARDQRRTRRELDRPYRELLAHRRRIR